MVWRWSMVVLLVMVASVHLLPVKEEIDNGDMEEIFNDLFREARDLDTNEIEEDAAEETAEDQDAVSSDPEEVTKYNTYMDAVYKRMNAALIAKLMDPMELNLSHNKDHKKKPAESPRKKGKKSEVSREARDVDDEDEEEDDLMGPKNKREARKKNKKEGKNKNEAKEAKNKKTKKPKKSKEERQREKIEKKKEKEEKKEMKEQKKAEKIAKRQNKKKKENKRNTRDVDDEDEEVENSEAVKIVEEEVEEDAVAEKVERKKKKKNANNENSEDKQKKKKNKNKNKKKNKNKNKNKDNGENDQKQQQQQQRARKNKNAPKKNRKNQRDSKSMKGRQASRVSGTLSGIATMRRTADVAVTKQDGFDVVSSEFSVGPLQLEVSKSMKEGEERSLRTAKATTDIMKGEMVVHVKPDGSATVQRVGFKKPDNVAVEGSVSDKAERAENFLKRSFYKSKGMAAHKILKTAKNILNTPVTVQ